MHQRTTDTAKKKNYHPKATKLQLLAVPSQLTFLDFSAFEVT
jgi:hypothetical protein